VGNTVKNYHTHPLLSSGNTLKNCANILVTTENTLNVKKALNYKTTHHLINKIIDLKKIKRTKNLYYQFRFLISVNNKHRPVEKKGSGYKNI